MKIAKLNVELLEQLFTQGNKINWTIKQGILPTDHFVNVSYKRQERILEFWFSELEDCKDIDILIEK